MEGTASARLLDWDAAARFGSRLAGAGPLIEPDDRARLRDDFTELVAEAESLVVQLTGLTVDGAPTRAWVMSRSTWIRENLRGFERVLSPFAARLAERTGDGALSAMRRKVLAAQVGGLLGYMGRKVLGQYDLFVPSEGHDLLYFIGPNVAELEARHRFAPRDFRLWLCLHEVAHRVQFGGVPWLRPYLRDMIDGYLASIELDGRKLIQTIRRAREEAVRGHSRGLGVLSLLMTPEQRETFRRLQAVMSLLEGHGNYVMAALSVGRIHGEERMRRTLSRRRHGPVDRVIQKAIGLDVKVRQYALGERFVSRVVRRAGMEGFNRVWERKENLPTLEEVGRPDAWVERVATT
ncbi:MAG TPA: zinc-dependent metalloprotease [Actinomycetota bacterium]|jgi:coenzyme F420 biosynthesis associated uncharacterized protein|nr:zinc-dependent metalloprotease [Actinomycetota bacterium]